MAAGLGFKDFVTGEVLTAADVDGYLMQGVWVFASAAARDAAVTSPQEGNFAYLKDTNVTTYYTGSAWANLDTTGMTNPMTTTGDTIYSSSGSTPARLGIGSTGQVLTVASGIPSWATPASGITFDNAEVATNQSTTSTSFTDLTTSGPAVTLTTSTKALVIISAYCKIDTADRGAYASFAISGSTTKSAGTVSGDTLSIAGPEDAFNTTVSASAACVVTLTAGSNTFTMKYARGGPSGSASFASRAIFVMRLN